MKLLNNYNDYIIDIIIEGIKNDELSLILSNKLIDILNNIDHEISSKLLSSHLNSNKKFKITLLDIDDTDDIKNFDKLIFMQSNKVYDEVNKYVKSVVGGENMNLDDVNNFIIKRHNNIFDVLNKNKATTTIGRIINKLFPNEFPNAGKNNSIESFVDKFKAERTKNMSVFKLVEGQDIIHYYNMDSYDSDSLEGTPLGNSCMRYYKCSKYIEFYVKNNVKLLILMSNNEKDKIIGRAIVWTNVIVNNESNRIFMDRIYTTYSSDINKFKEYAIKNNWLYKTNQNREATDYIFDPITNDANRLTLRVDNIIQTDAYPYLDTIKFLDIKNNTLTNKYSNQLYNLESTQGGYHYKEDSYIYNPNINQIELEYQDDEDDDDDNEDTLWSEVEQQTIDADDARYSDYLQSWASPYYADNYWVYSEMMDDYIPIDDYVETYEDYVTQEYAEINLKYSEYYEKWYKPEDLIWSNKQGWIYKYDVVNVYLDMKKTKSDIRADDNDYTTYTNENGEVEYYDDDMVGDQFIRVKSDLQGRRISLKKEEDKDKYFKWKNDYYLNKLKNEVTGQFKMDI